MNRSLVEILSNYELGQIKKARPFGNGHINKTFLIETNTGKYILQKISTAAFKDVHQLMQNMLIVTSCLRRQGVPTIEIIKTTDNSLYVEYHHGFFRVYRYIDNTVTYETLNGDLSLASKLGATFGEFHAYLSCLDPHTIEETIPHFHDTPKRYNDFLNAISEADQSKIDHANKEIQKVLSWKNKYSILMDALKEEIIPLRVIHNDAKINNILFKNGEPYCVVDLDTVMPGTVLFDIGDAFRSLFTGENEDNPDLSLQTVKLDIFETYMRGYLSKTKSFISKEGIKLIPEAIFLMTIECGMRFLEDYLRGNVYFHVQYEEHNLVRARTQITLAEDILMHQEDFKRILKKLDEEKQHETKCQ